MQIEHIHPTEPHPDWDAGDDRTWLSLTPDEQGQYRLRAQTIGNLTLLDSALHRRTVHRSFHEKQRGAYSDSTVAALKDEILPIEVWSIEALDNRTDNMIDRFLEIWPRAEGDFADEGDPYTRVVDLDGTAADYRFDHAVDGEDIVSDAHDVRSLYATLMTRLWAQHGLALRTFTAEQGWDLIVENRATRRGYLQLDASTWLYEGWTERDLLDALRLIIEHFGQSDDVRVALTSSSGE